MLGDEPVWVDWPYATEARVVCVTGPHERCWRDRRGALSRCDVHPAEWKQLQADLAKTPPSLSQKSKSELLTSPSYCGE